MNIRARGTGRLPFTESLFNSAMDRGKTAFAAMIFVSAPCRYWSANRAP